MTIVQAIDAKSGRTTTSKNIMDALSYYFEAAEKMSIADNVKPVRGHNIVRAIDAYAGNDYSRTIVEAIDKYTGKGPSMNIMAAIENLESVEPDPPTPPTPPTPVKTVWVTGGSFSGTVQSEVSTEITPITYNPISGIGRVSITLENLTVGSDIRGTETYSSSESDLEVIDGKPVEDITIYTNPPWLYDDPYFRIVSDPVTEGLSVVIHNEVEMDEPYPISWDSLKIEFESNV